MTGDVTSRQIVPKSPACPEGLFLMDGIEGLRSLPKHSVDMLLTDPPYGTTRNFWDVPLPLPELWEAVKWAVKPDGAVLFFAQCPYDKVLGASNLSITKPFSMPVLLRKIAAVLRRSNRETDEKYQIITYGNLLLNCDSYTATVDGANFELTQKEFEILRELLTHQGRILTRQNLLDKLWRYDFYGDERVVDTHIKNLRKKLGIDFIQTIRGVGYKVDKEN